MVKIAVSVLAIALASIALIGLSFLDYASLKSAIDSLAPDGNAEQFTHARHNTAIVLFWTYSAIGALASFLIYSLRYQLIAIDIAKSFAHTRRDSIAYVRDSKSSHLWCCATILFGGIVLRILSLDQPIRSDESWTLLNYASRNLLQIVSLYDSPNNHVLHSVLAHVSMSMFGEDPVVLRLPAVVAGISCMPLGYWLFYRLGDRCSAIFALALIAGWPMLVDYSTNARGYSMLVCFTLALLICADVMRARASIFAAGGYVLICALGLYTIPSFAISILIAGVWMLWACIRGTVSTSRWQFIAQQTQMAGAVIALTLLLYSPVIAFSGMGALLSNEVVTGTGVNMSDVPILAWAIFTDWHQGIPPWLVVLIIMGFLISLFRHFDERLSFWFATLVSGVIISSLQGTLGPPRIWIILLPLLLGGAGLWCTDLANGKIRSFVVPALSVGVFSLLFALHLGQPTNALYRAFGAFPQAREIVEYAAETMTANDAVLTMFPARRTMAYYDLRQNGKLTIMSKQGFLPDDFSGRALIVAPVGRSDDEVFAWTATQGNTLLRTRPYRIVSAKPFGEVSVVEVQFEQVHQPEVGPIQ